VTTSSDSSQPSTPPPTGTSQQQIDPSAPSEDRRPPGRDQIAGVAAVDGVGFTVTVVAAVLLAVTDVTGIGRWVALAALAVAALTGAVTTVTVVWLLARRRTYVTNIKEVALLLESRRGLGPSRRYVEHAESLRAKAIEFGEEGLAARLDTAISVAYSAERYDPGPPRTAA
jgi:hypothetical protein